MLGWDGMERSGGKFGGPITPTARVTTALALLLALLPLLDCASPGPPRPPSLHLPERVRDLSASRVGNRVELRFTVPERSTDKLPLGSGALSGTACRAEGSGPCVPVGGALALQSMPLRDAAGNPAVVTLNDPLEARLLSGPPRPLSYRVEFFSRSHRSAGPSEPALAAAGEAPPVVAGLEAEGSREGVLLSWQASASAASAEVLLRREHVPVGAKAQAGQKSRGRSLEGTAGAAGPAGAGGPAGAAGPASAETVWLRANNSPDGGGGNKAAAENKTLDTSATPGETYGYAAQRRQTVRIAGQELELRSELSAPVALQLGESFPPPPPSGLTAAGFGDRDHYAIDLIWEPVPEPVAEATGDRAVVGYLVRRSTVASPGVTATPPLTLTPAAAAAPAFHDSTADPALRYRYEVIAVDGKGNRSAAATVIVEPSAMP